MSNEQEVRSVINWFEIPAFDLERAAGFYEKILSVKLKRERMGGGEMAVFPYARPGVSGAIMNVPELAGRATGTVIYLNCDDRLDEVAGRVKEAGGTVLTPRVDLPEGMGAFFHIEDSEGNRVGLHGMAKA
ncbi:MAG: VOC family protein [Rhizobiales bacterium]|jgi:predicted enzyme related to lactoylglutathione lyase|nr:VOC family protein [Hyphomicrobiales bacterium]MBN9010243.1 VOC family protein [Hyphomicrobiales bacterium]